jgi:broad specificity phosphatase PhoE
MEPRRPEIWVIRHGETAWSREGRHTGRTDVALTANGERQSIALGRRLGGREFTLVLSSPLRRAWDTCRLAGYDGVAQVTDLLREWDYGSYEGRTSAEIQREAPGWTVWTGVVPAGESAETVGHRADQVIERAVAAGGDAALFGHGHLLRVLAARWLGLSPRGGRLFALDAASIGVLGYEYDTRIIRTWNVAVDGYSQSETALSL